MGVQRRTASATVRREEGSGNETDSSIIALQSKKVRCAYKFHRVYYTKEIPISVVPMTLPSFSMINSETMWLQGDS